MHPSCQIFIDHLPTPFQPPPPPPTTPCLAPVTDSSQFIQQHMVPCSARDAPVASYCRSVGSTQQLSGLANRFTAFGKCLRQSKAVHSVFALHISPNPKSLPQLIPVCLLTRDGGAGWIFNNERTSSDSRALQAFCALWVTEL